ncbi:MAG: glutathione S-transferase family protein [Phaeobacter italicus]|jgi:glutathione S-transferase|uniref:Glutathione S-transferase GST-4.5 n=1 Tax=Phaeobacter italicus TaxID=481446 RepID=A0A0H5D660_9RHOB|nr:glutathione S-transferase family protein [Phaeobacter italicus]MEC8015903.1 glutathione S-transferase family protein [Pseudomonadota bacterium]MBO9443509.1 glutathione S-transferase family protein [Phaeobacter italicus]MBY6045164.1 glutathione S-transferase family protein [Phaeobacter italicus]MEC8573482.1 glutathione S-transferase family protein [Pseudomonadota bacterium]MEE2816948.1 glutathione S-transferase family protein [Pseudomonadota bacterium]
MYTVIGKQLTRCYRVLWALEELGQEYDLNPALPQSPDVLALNPSGKVPILVEDGEAITDSTAIITYLADKHGQLTAPAGTLARAKQDAVTHMLLDELDAVLWTAARHSFILPEDKRVPEVKDSLKWEFARSLNRLEARMQGPYLMGEDFTIADIICTHCLNWAYSAKFPLENKALLEYSKRMRSRPAFQKVAASVK